MKNMSGCLDLGAFIGHRVFDLHTFYDQMQYQSYEIFLQSPLLTIESFDESIIEEIRRQINDRTVSTPIFVNVLRTLSV